MPTYSLLTTIGRNKEAAALASGEPLTIAEIAFGDGDYAPTGGETQLKNEIDRRAVQGSGVVAGAPNTAFFEVLLEAAEGPFTIREGGAFDADGDLIAIVKYDPPINKPSPASGQTVEALLRLHVAFSDLENLVVRIEANTAFVSAGRQILTTDGVSGGGDLSQTRTLKLDVAGLATIAPETVNSVEDWVVLHDTSAGKPKKMSPSKFSEVLKLDDKIQKATRSGRWLNRLM